MKGLTRFWIFYHCFHSPTKRTVSLGSFGGGLWRNALFRRRCRTRPSCTLSELKIHPLKHSYVPDFFRFGLSALVGSSTSGSGSSGTDTGMLVDWVIFDRDLSVLGKIEVSNPIALSSAKNSLPLTPRSISFDSLERNFMGLLSSSIPRLTSSRPARACDELRLSLLLCPVRKYREESSASEVSVSYGVSLGVCCVF
jgi:hypothetical protein